MMKDYKETNMRPALYATYYAMLRETAMDNGGNCGWYNDKPTYKGPNGGCYYINSNGNKTYVDAQYCPC